MNGRIIQKETDINNKLPRIGFIRVGQKIISQKGKEIPTSLDYFIADGNYAMDFVEAYGDKPQQIKILFPNPNIEHVCNERWEIWNTKKHDGIGGRLFGFGDGENFCIYNSHKKDYDVKTKEKFPTLGKDAEKESGGKWQQVLILRFIVLGIKGVLGYWQFSTHGSKSSIPTIRNAFDAVYNEIGDKICQVPFDLNVKKVTSNKPGERSKYPVVNLVCNVSKDRLHLVLESKTNEIFLPDKKLKMIGKE